MTLNDNRDKTRFKLTNSMAIFDDQTYRLDNWSRGGARIREYEGARQAGESFPIALEVTTDQGRIRLVGEGTVAWREDGVLGLQWTLDEGADDLDVLLGVFLK